MFRLFALLFALVCNIPLIKAQPCYSLTAWNTGISHQSRGGRELILNHRQDIADSAYEIIIHYNLINSFGAFNLNNGDDIQPLFFKYYLTDSCQGKYKKLYDIFFYPAGIPSNINSYYKSINPYTGDSLGKRIHPFCNYLPDPPNPYYVIYDTVQYMRDYMVSQIIYLPYTCGKWQIGWLENNNIQDSSSNIYYPCTYNSLNPNYFGYDAVEKQPLNSNLIQFSNLLPNNMPGYASDLDFLCKAYHPISIPLNAIDPEGDSLAFKSVKGVCFRRQAPFYGYNPNLYGDIMPYQMALQFNINSPTFYDTMAVACDTQYTEYKCIPGQSGPSCTTYNPVNNPFDCDSTFNVNPNTGEITFTTKTANQHVDLTIKVDEYRQGQWLSTSYRVIRIHTIDSGYVSNPILKLDTAQITGCALDTALTFYACAGNNISIPYSVKGLANNSYLTLSDNVGFSIPNSTMAYQNNVTDSVHGIFNWQVPVNDSGWHFFTLQIKDSACNVSDYIYQHTKLFKIYISKPNLKTINDTIICQGQNIQLTTQGSLNQVQWNILSGTANSLSCNPCGNPFATPTQKTVYECVSTICQARDTVTIDVLEPFTVSVQDKLICGNAAAVSLTAQANGINPNRVNVNWTANPAITSALTNFTISVDPNIDTQFVVTIADTLGCFSASDTAIINYDENFAPIIQTLQNEICLGDSSLITILGTGVGTTNILPNYNIGNWQGNNIRVAPETNTNYTITVSSPASPCTASKNLDIEVVELRADAGPDHEIYDGEEVTLGGPNMLCGGGCQITWLPTTSLFDITSLNPFSRPLQDIRYVVILKSDKAGCQDRDTVDIVVKCTDIYMPNVFQPEGQQLDARDRSFGPNNWGLEIEDFRIYNRWGEQVFIKGDDGYRWNGILNGKPQPQGVYVYFIKAKCPNSNKTIVKQGNVTLLR